MRLLGTPLAASKITWHLRETACGVAPARVSDSKMCLCDGSSPSAVAGVNIAPLDHVRSLLSIIITDRTLAARAMPPPDTFPVAPPIEPMLARLTSALPTGPFLYEPKWDGF